jgi:FAD-dependent urate hydroxylase
LLQAAGHATVKFETSVVGFEQDADGVSVATSSGAQERVDILVAADGIHSKVREGMFPLRRAYYTGWTVWQGIAVMHLADVGDPQTFQSLWSRDAAATLMPMTDNEVFWFVSLRLPAHFEHRLEPSDAGWETVRAAVRQTPEDRLNRTDLYEARPLRRWTSGRVALLGDAAHAMRPTIGMGGCQAIEDAFALAACLKRNPSAAGLLDYQSARRGRAREMWWQSFMMPRLMNPQRPIPNWVRDLSLKTLPRPILASMFRRMLTPSRASLPIAEHHAPR